jgi:23S rRNA (uracil1939-C5)-methyltransferase
MPQIKVEKLVFGGQALGYYNDKPIFVWNALPGEVVEVDITKHRKGVYEGVAREVIEKSEDRIAAQEAHFLSCSPWQIMTYEAENKHKLEICAEAFKKINILPSPQYHFPQERFGYRNKMEYSLQVINGKTNLALNERQGHNFVNCSHCVLPDEALQTTATAIEAWLNQGVLTRRLLKSLIIRSDGTGKTIAGLFVKDRVSFVNPKIDCKNLQGWDIYFSTHRSPASVVTEVLYQSGEAYLTATIDGKKFKFGMESFMQNNMVMYEHALNEMKKWINEGDELLDMFSGVGSIGICLAGKKTKTYLSRN